MTFAELIAAALAALEREAPQYAAGMARALGSVSVGITVNGQPVRLRASSGVVSADRSGGEVSVRIVTRNATVVSLVDGRCGIVEAVEAGRLEAWGTPSDLETVDAALQRFLSGAVRGASVRGLWRRYRRAAASSAGFDSEERPHG